MPDNINGRMQQRQASRVSDEPTATGIDDTADASALDASALLRRLASAANELTPATVAAELRRCRSEHVRIAVLRAIGARWGIQGVQRTLEAVNLLDGADVRATPVGEAAGNHAAVQGGVAQVEGETFFCPPDGSLSTEIPPESATPKKTDADYESATGVKAAIDAKRMVPVAGIHGKTFTAVGCGGKKDGTVSFTFVRAFVGDYAYPAAGRDVRGAHVSISVALDGCGEHGEIKLVQVLREITRKDGKMVDREPDSAKRKERAGWDDPKASSRGWQVDEIDAGQSPFYASSPIYGNDGSSHKPAKLRDTPGEWATDRNVGAEFRTCAVSYAGGKGTMLACMEWGYYLDDAGKVSFYPATPTAHAGPVPQALDAMKRWDEIPGTTKANIK